MKVESKFQKELINRIRDLYPDCIILKNDANYLQGVPDLLVLYRSTWAFLEVKRNASADHQPNQDYYIELANDWAFGAIVYPENLEDVLDDLQHAFSH